MAIEIQCEACGVWAEDIDICPCGEPRGEYVMFRGPEADMVLLPIWLRGAGATPNDPSSS